ncbi:MAG TPA: carbohydrate kinase [Burkholderiaceae bacterium]|nr:carbohydrate kinase [Burkholderiaceae bacterium]
MFVVCGEALMDVFAQGDTKEGMTLDARVGGSPFNVAVGLARMAQPVTFLGGISTGFLGDRLMRALRQEGVDTRCVQRIDAPTTLGLVGLDAHGVPSYAFYGEGAADRLLTVNVLNDVPEQTRLLQFGSYAMVVEPTALTLRALIERTHERRAQLIAYDPNVRLNVEPSLDRWRETLAWMLPRTQLLKVSEEDLGLLRPGSDPESLAREALSKGVSMVVVTRGGLGALAWTADGARAEVGATPVRLVDTVGAGDTFQAALLTWLAEHDALSDMRLRALHAEALHDALAFASKAAALTCSRRGADLPRRAELS